MTDPLVPQCPVCNAAVSLETTPTAPFCSDRCRLVDL
ncbi:MAG: DNA gyrase inhibitor YacG, partial [Pirellulales bacterium]|nr:DNA gyrase inhibitor YacG [Pirellulales bacterium]